MWIEYNKLCVTSLLLQRFTSSKTSKPHDCGYKFIVEDGTQKVVDPCRRTPKYDATGQNAASTNSKVRNIDLMFSAFFENLFKNFKLK